ERKADAIRRYGPDSRAELGDVRRGASDRLGRCSGPGRARPPGRDRLPARGLRRAGQVPRAALVSSSQTFVGQVMNELAAAFEPLEDGLAGPNGFALLLAQFGWSVPTSSALSQVTGLMSGVGQALTALDQAATAVQTVLDG